MPSKKRATPISLQPLDGMQIKKEDYKLVYVGELSGNMSLDDIFERFNIDRPEDFRGHSLSVSDIIVLNDGEKVTAHFVDSISFEQLDSFLNLEEQVLSELAYEVGERYFAIQRTEEGYDYSFYDEDVQIYAAYHPTDHTLRLKDLEYADRVKIGDNTWIGGGSIILNGVTIGKNTVIGAGSVVTKDIPDNVVAVGNPCRVIKRLDKENVENGKRLKFTDFAHINIVVDDIDEGIKYYEQLLEAKPIQIFREFSNIGFAKAAGFLEHPELVKLSIAFMEIPGTKLTLELMEYYEPVTTDAKHREDVNKINGVRHVALEIQNIDEAFKYIKTCPDITLINPSEQYGPYKIDDITADEVQFFEADMEADGNIKKQLCQTISNTYYFYFIDKYGVQWEFEQGHDY